MQFYLTSLRGKECFAKLNQQSGAGAVFWPLGAGVGAGAGASLKKYQEPEPLWKKIRTQSRLKKRQEPEPKSLKNKAGSSSLLHMLANLLKFEGKILPQNIKLI